MFDKFTAGGKGHAVLIHYHLVVSTALTQASMGQIPCSMLGSQTPELCLKVSGRSPEKYHCSFCGRALLMQHLRDAALLLIVLFQ